MLKLKEVITTCKEVVNSSKHVKINYEVLDNLVKNIEREDIKYWLDSNPFNILDFDYKTLINFLLVYHTIGDYCFWGEPKWEIDTKVGKLDGSFAMMYIMIERFRENKDFNLTLDEFKKLLKGNVEIPLLEDRYNNLVQMNKFLSKNKKDFYTLVRDYTKDEDLINYLIDNLSYFKDESTYNGRTVFFYKRAQLLTSDILHVREKLEHIKVDYKSLAGCADYKIPQVMRCYKILEFDDELKSLIDNKKEIEKESDYEVEIRAADIVVIDYIASKLDYEITRIDINDYIWLLGQDKTKMTLPYHRTLTNNY